MTDAPLHMLVYLSALQPRLTEPELEALVHDSRTRNTAAGITGVLLHADGDVIQYLEGPEAAVRATFGRIARDPRHRSIVVAVDAELPARVFPRWLMGHLQVTRSQFLALESADWRAVASQTGTEPARGDGTPPGLILLRSFAENARSR